MSEFDFRDYLSAIVTSYSNQRHLYTLTDVLLPLEARSVEREEEGREQRVEQFPVLAGLRRYALGDAREHVLLAGRPGSGKSTALRQLVVELAADGLVPVLVQLKGSAPVLEAIGNELERGDLELEPKEIKRLLRHQRLILLFDGVNEIPTEPLRQQLQEFRAAYPQTPMIFTTRDLAIGGSLGISKQLEMKPLSPEQLREFVVKYLPEQGEKLLGQLRDRLREIAETPLLLKMLCDVFGQTGEIPPNKGELFRLFDREYEKFKSLPAVSADFRRFKSEILQHLAFVMMQGNESKPTEFWLTIARSQAERSIEQLLTNRVSDPAGKAKEWLEDLLEHHLLQVAADGRRVEFHHQLFQEYYAAEALLGMFADRRPEVVEPERFQHFYLNYLKWTESVAIVLSLTEDENTAADLVKQALDVDLMLGARLAGEVRSRFQGSSVKIINGLIQHSPSGWLKAKYLQEFEHPHHFLCTKNRLLQQEDQLSPMPSLEQCKEWLNSSDDYVRGNSSYFLGLIANQHAVNHCERLSILETLHAIIKNDLSWSVRSRTIHSIEIIRNSQSIKVLIDLAVNPEEDQSLREQALWSLRHFSVSDVCQYVSKMYSLLYTKIGETAFEAIQVIQANCKFYNYEIFHSPPAKPQPTQPSPPATTSYQFPNVTEVKIIEHIDNYHASPPRDPPP